MPRPRLARPIPVHTRGGPLRFSRAAGGHSRIPGRDQAVEVLDLPLLDILHTFASSVVQYEPAWGGSVRGNRAGGQNSRYETALRANRREPPYKRA